MRKETAFAIGISIASTNGDRKNIKYQISNDDVEKTNILSVGLTFETKYSRVD